MTNQASRRPSRRVGQLLGLVQDPGAEPLGLVWAALGYLVVGALAACLLPPRSPADAWTDPSRLVLIAVVVLGGLVGQAIARRRWRARRVTARD